LVLDAGGSGDPCQRLCVTRPMARSHRGARARSRVKVVGVAVSSRKTKRCGATAAIAPRHACRCAQSRSAAIRDFFEGQPEPPQRPRHRGRADGAALCGRPVGAVLDQCDIRLRPHWSRSTGSAAPYVALPSPARHGRYHAQLAATLLPPPHGPFAGAKGAGGPRPCQPGVQGTKQAVAKVGRVLLHPRRIAPRSTPMQRALSACLQASG
jgi:hypothetical protein